jgi:ribokinase
VTIPVVLFRDRSTDAASRLYGRREAAGGRMAEEPKTGVAILGIYVADASYRASRLPRMGETILGEAFTLGPGGKGANQAVAAARAGGEVAFITKLGDDPFGAMARSLWAEAGIDTRHVAASDTPTGSAFIFVDAGSGNNAIIVVPGAGGTLGPDDVRAAEAAIAGAAVFVTQLEQPAEAALAGLALARRHGAITIFNPAPAVPFEPAIYPLCDYIIPNESEAEALTGIAVTDEASARRAGDAFLALGVGCALITLGAKGALLHRRDSLRPDSGGAGRAGGGHHRGRRRVHRRLRDRPVARPRSGRTRRGLPARSPASPSRGSARRSRCRAVTTSTPCWRAPRTHDHRTSGASDSGPGPPHRPRGAGLRRAPAGAAGPTAPAPRARPTPPAADRLRERAVRAHYMPLFSRLGAYDRALLDSAAWQRRHRAAFEYWGHEASLIRLDLHPLFRGACSAPARDGIYGGRPSAREARVIERASRRSRRGSRSAPADLETADAARVVWGWSDGKRALEWLFWAGVVTTATRRGFERLYDLRAGAARLVIVRRHLRPRRRSASSALGAGARIASERCCATISDMKPRREGAARSAGVQGGDLVRSRRGMDARSILDPASAPTARIEARALCCRRSIVCGSVAAP